MADPVDGFQELLAVLDRLELGYMVGGSGASSIHGHWRATGDIDLLVRLGPGDLDLLVAELENRFYIDEESARDALQRHRSFSVIHIDSAFKFDLFPLAGDPYQQKAFSRRRFESSRLFGDQLVEFAVASPEDVVLNKLKWYRLGGEVSEQQWNDVLGVIAVQGDRLHLAYMREWADYLNVTDLLEQALTEKH